MAKPNKNTPQPQPAITRHVVGTKVVSITTLPGVTVRETFATQIDAALARIESGLAPRGYVADKGDAIRLLSFNLKAYLACNGGAESDLADKETRNAWNAAMAAFRKLAMEQGEVPDANIPGFTVVSVTGRRYGGFDSVTGMPSVLQQSVRLRKELTRQDRSDWLRAAQSYHDRQCAIEDAAKAAAEKK